MRLEGLERVDRPVVSTVIQLFVSQHHVLPLVFRIGIHVGGSPDVGRNVPISGSVIDVIQNLLAALGHALECCVGIREIQKVRLGGLLGTRRDENEFAVEGLAEMNPVQHNSSSSWYKS